MPTARRATARRRSRARAVRAPPAIRSHSQRPRRRRARPVPGRPGRGARARTRARGAAAAAARAARRRARAQGGPRDRRTRAASPRSQAGSSGRADPRLRPSARPRTRASSCRCPPDHRGRARRIRSSPRGPGAPRARHAVRSRPARLGLYAASWRTPTGAKCGGIPTSASVAGVLASTGMRRLTVRVLVAVGLALLLYARAAGPARADTYFVSTPTELQSAITSAAATDGDDTINLAAGTFDIGNTIGTVQLRAFGFAVPSGENAITLVGAGPGLTVLDGDGSFGEVVAVTGSSTMTIRSLTIRNGGDGVDAVEQGVTLDDVVIRDNTGNAFTGGNLTISDSTVTNNVEGIDVECGIVATNTTIADNAGTGLGVDCTNWNSGLSNVTVAGNGVGIDFDDSIELDNSIVAGNTAQDCEVQPGRDPTGTNDLI